MNPANTPRTSAHLLVGKDEEFCVLQLFLVHHGEQLGLVDVESLAVCRVDDVHDRLGVGVVASPVRPDRSLPAQVPHLPVHQRGSVKRLSCCVRARGGRRTWNFKFLYWTVSTLKPMVGMVVTTSPICIRYKIVVFPLCSCSRI